ncbi:hypothetical protein SISNIDRAFT_436411 [Sistotremastrum niveocremeum HHB9708]|uniref:RING-type E3 ubiquitin transferase (cysteine targeting) n=1 Tax=Sistotremastrum niveocremeum HHB9708 TaxID=1314777 RepID=A0A164ZJG4_9AGAM|nr:hypothetical protein SISNIDRAFT_436411 [Sistotremastrum niveocremeum HHB9708]
MAEASSSAHPPLDIWQQAWERAQPRLRAISEALPFFPVAQARLTRVGQLDAELLDTELIELLKQPISKALRLIDSTVQGNTEPELTLLLRVVLYKLSIWDRGASYGAWLQNLHLTRPTSSTQNNSSLTPAGLPRKLMVLHGFLTIVVPYLYTRCRDHALSHAWPDIPSYDLRRKLWNALSFSEASHNALSLVGFLAFLWDGRYRTLTDRLLRLKLTPTRRASTRNVSYEFMNRQMVWHAFTEFLLFLLPLVNTRRLRRHAKQTVHDFTSSLSQYLLRSTSGKMISEEAEKRHEKGKSVALKGKYWSLPERECAICAEDALSRSTSKGIPATNLTDSDTPKNPIHVPYVASCGHTYCYFCLADRLLRVAEDGDSGWNCLRCTEKITTIDRLQYTDSSSDADDELDILIISDVDSSMSMSR